MVGSCQIHSTTVDIKLITQVFAAHRRTFNMPTWKTYAPRCRPAHNMFWLRFYPKCKIQSSFFLILTAKFSRIIQQVFQITIGQNGIIMLFGVFIHIKVYGTVYFISITVVDNLLDHLDLFRNMSRSSRLDAWWQCVE